MVGVLVCVPVYAVIVRTPAFDPKTEDVMAEPVKKVSADGRPTAGGKDKPPANGTSTDRSVDTNLLSPQFPAPAVTIWNSVAKVLGRGPQEVAQRVGPGHGDRRRVGHPDRASRKSSCRKDTSNGCPRPRALGWPA